MGKTPEITAASTAQLADCVSPSSSLTSLLLTGESVGVSEHLYVCEYLSFLAAAGADAAAAASFLTVQDYCSAPLGFAADKNRQKVHLRPDLNATFLKILIN